MKPKLVWIFLKSWCKQLGVNSLIRRCLQMYSSAAQIEQRRTRHWEKITEARRRTPLEWIYKRIINTKRCSTLYNARFFRNLKVLNRAGYWCLSTILRIGHGMGRCSARLRIRGVANASFHPQGGVIEECGSKAAAVNNKFLIISEASALQPKSYAIQSINSYSEFKTWNRRTRQCLTLTRVPVTMHGIPILCQTYFALSWVLMGRNTRFALKPTSVAAQVAATLLLNCKVCSSLPTYKT